MLGFSVLVSRLFDSLFFLVCGALLRIFRCVLVVRGWVWVSGSAWFGAPQFFVLFVFFNFLWTWLFRVVCRSWPFSVLGVFALVLLVCCVALVSGSPRVFGLVLFYALRYWPALSGVLFCLGPGLPHYFC